MTPFSLQRLTTVTDAQVEEISALCVQAFDGEPARKAYLGGKWDLHEEYCRASTRATALEGELYIVVANNEIVSTASWFAPGRSLQGTPEQRVLGYDEFYKKLSLETKYWHEHTLPDLFKRLEAGAFTEEERVKRYWLANLATKPGHEGKGYATALVDFFYNKVTADGMFFGLATGTELNVKKYIAMGCRKRGSAYLSASTGGFCVQILSREASRNKNTTRAQKEDPL